MLRLIKTHKFLAIGIFCILLMVCGQGHADQKVTIKDAQSENHSYGDVVEPRKSWGHSKFKSTRDLYNICKKALNTKQFEESYCSAYMEAFLGGSYVSNMYILSQATNQDEIMEAVHKNKCSKWKSASKNNPPGKGLATYFVDWVDNNRDIISELDGKNDDFSNRPAFSVLHFISTDEKFCTQ